MFEIDPPPDPRESIATFCDGMFNTKSGDSIQDCAQQQIVSLIQYIACRYEARLEKEIYAAWRAGYSHLDVVTNKTKIIDPSKRVSFIPHMGNSPAYRADEHRIERFDLTDVPAEEMNDLIR